jgi:hypothetical protein
MVNMMSLFAFAMIPCWIMIMISLPTVNALCGDTGQANFHATADLPQGQYGELATAIRCLLKKELCDDTTALPLLARGSDPTDASQVMTHYGSDLKVWCTGLVTDMSYVFSDLYDVSSWAWWRVGVLFDSLRHRHLESL